MITTLSVSILAVAGVFGECRSTDCDKCYYPNLPFSAVWYEFWCNIAPPCDCRQRHEPWPLEYPGARERGWQAQGTAVRKGPPLPPPPSCAPVVLNEDGRLIQVFPNGTARDLSDPAPIPQVYVEPPEEPTKKRTWFSLFHKK